MREHVKALTRTILLGLLWLYRNGVSRLKPPCCRFDPTCSAYAGEAIRRFGAGRGSWLAARRLLRCHPFYRGPPHDPVPPAAGPSVSVDSLS